MSLLHRSSVWHHQAAIDSRTSNRTQWCAVHLLRLYPSTGGGHHAPGRPAGAAAGRTTPTMATARTVSRLGRAIMPHPPRPADPARSRQASAFRCAAIRRWATSLRARYQVIRATAGVACWPVRQVSPNSAKLAHRSTQTKRAPSAAPAIASWCSTIQWNRVDRWRGA